MDQGVFERFRSIIHEHSGIALAPEKMPLLSNRLQRRLRELGLSSEKQYLQIVETDESGEELWKLIEAVSTNTTHFYREPQHFVVLDKVLKNWAGKGKTKFKIWCAAASSGEEPYTLAFQASQSLDLSKNEVRILATDINTKVLRHAVNGVYSAQSVSTVPEDVRKRFLEAGEGAATYAVRPEAKKLLTFKKLNLVEFPYPLKGGIDIIFCRNVMIYFDLETREKIVNEFERQLLPGGLLFLSHSEGLIGITHNLKRYDSSVFIKTGS